MAKKTKSKKAKVLKTRKKNTTKKTNSKEHILLRAYREMAMDRAIDKKNIVLYKQNKCHFHADAIFHHFTFLNHHFLFCNPSAGDVFNGF